MYLLLLLMFAINDEGSGVILFSEEDMETARLLRDQAMEQSAAFDIVASLTTEVGPRMAGTPADLKAVDWGLRTFKALGFDKVYTEPVSYPTWQRRSESAQILEPVQQPLVITALGRSVGTPEDGLTGDVVQLDSYQALEECDPSVVSGKIVFIRNRMEQLKTGRGYGRAVVARTKGASVAAKKGAIALVIRSIGTDSDRLAHTGVLRYEEDVTKIPAAALSNPDADLLERVFEMGQTVSLSLRMDCGPGPEFSSFNVIGEVTGSETPERVVLIGGHLDSWDLGTGAIDDGAGCAITMAAAKMIAELEQRPRSTIRVVLFANEEQGIYGGKAYAEAHKNQVAQHIVGSESDFGAGRIWQLSSKVRPEALAAVDQMVQILAPIGVSRGNNKGWGGPDLGPMRQLGMSVFSLRQDGTDYFNWHHTANDTLDKINRDDLNQNVAVYAVFAYLSAQYRGDYGSGKLK